MAVSTSAVLFYTLLVRYFVTGSTCSAGYFMSENRNCIACPEHCLVCDSEDYCLYCEKGYWGKVCELVCSNCMPGTSCQKTNGFCKEGCTYGYSGILCNEKCDNKCITCTRENPQNCSKCTPGRYPVLYCDKICSGCLEQNCNETGVCTLTCVNGFWGQRCEQKCSQHCKDAACDRENGTCIFGCNDNYAGLQCHTTDSNIRDKNSTPVIPIIVAVTVAAIVLSGIIILCVLYRKRKKSPKDSQPENAELLHRTEDQAKKKTSDKLQPIRIYLRKEGACRVIDKTGGKLFECLSKCIVSLISLNDSREFTEKMKMFESAKTLQEEVVTLLKNHAYSWKTMLPMLVNDFPMPKDDSNATEQSEYLKQIEEYYAKIMSECSKGTYNQTYAKLLLYALATCIKIPIYVISFDQQWHYFEPLFAVHEQSQKIQRYITMCLCPDSLFYKVQPLDRNAPPPKPTGLVGMYMKCLEDTPTLSIRVPNELTKIPKESKIDICNSVGEDVIRESCDILLQTKLIKKKKYTSLTTKTDRLADFCRKITGNEEAFGILCKVLIKRREKCILLPYIQNETSCEYLSQYEAVLILDNAIVERNVSVKMLVANFLNAAKAVTEGFSTGIASTDVVPAPVSFGASLGLRIVGGVLGGGTDYTLIKSPFDFKIREKRERNMEVIKEIQKTMHKKELNVSSEVEKVEKLFKTTLHKGLESGAESPAVRKNWSMTVDALGATAHEAQSVASIAVADARLGSVAAAVSASVFGPLSLVVDIALLAEAALDERKSNIRGAGHNPWSMREIVNFKCKIFNNMLRGDFENEKRMFEPVLD